MGPEQTFDISTLKVTLPKLASDGSNWPTYKDRIINALTSKKLRRHVIGSALKPKEPTKGESGQLYQSGSLVPMSDAEIEKYEDSLDEWMQKKAQVREVIYGTVDQSTFLQIKREPTAAAVWSKLISIHDDRGHMFEADLLAQLQSLRFVEGDDMTTHLTKLTSIKERLAEVGTPLTDE
ncbi:hypothetical protein B0H34DRAFT_659125, partial [Crassisporium funariophilum]